VKVEQLFKQPAEIRPDMVFRGIDMSFLKGLDAGQEIKIATPSTKLVCLIRNFGCEPPLSPFQE